MTSPDTEALVKRYNSANIMWSMDGAKLRHDPSGEWVRFSDYEAAESRVSALSAEVERVKAALTPSADTKAAYWGEFYIGVTLRAGREEEYRRVQIPWDSIKEIMAAISVHASLNGGSDHG